VLARSPRRVFTRRELVESVFEAAEDEGVVDTYVHYLRRKLHRGVVVTVRGLGYRLGTR
jgi:two-component system response regulator QseB